jgi:hypothetical protein
VKIVRDALRRMRRFFFFGGGGGSFRIAELVYCVLNLATHLLVPALMCGTAYPFVQSVHIDYLNVKATNVEANRCA